MMLMKRCIIISGICIIILWIESFFRYLRATGLVAVSHIGKSLTIVHERIEEVDYILAVTPRDAFAFEDEISY